MALKFSAKRKTAAGGFPATYDVTSTGLQKKKGEIAKQRKRIEDVLKAEKKAQEKSLLATPVFILLFKWTRVKGQSIRFKLVVNVVRDKRFKPPPGNGTEVPPKPKNSTIPPP